MMPQTKSVSLFSMLASIAVLAGAIALTGQSAFTQTVDPGTPATMVTGPRANGNSSGAVTNVDGSCTAFYSDASNLIPRDTNLVRDVFLYRESEGSIERVSLGGGDQQSNGPSQAEGLLPAIASDCSCVAFSSDATNLVDDDTNGRTDVFIRDLGTDSATVRVSLGDEGQANGASFAPSLTDDCQIVAFQSSASNLVAGDTNRLSDVFLRNRLNGTTTLVSIGEGGEPADGFSVTPSISADGRCVAFASEASNLVPNDDNHARDIFVACDGAITCWASVDGAGKPGNGDSFLPSLSADGQIVAFKSAASNLVTGDTNSAVDVFVHDCQSGQTTRASVSSLGDQADSLSFPPSISDNGNLVAFGSGATNLIRGRFIRRTQIYLHNLQTGETTLVSAGPAGDPANGGVPDLAPGISGDGKVVSFASSASNLAAGDDNDVLDIFVARVAPKSTPTPTLSPTPTPTEKIVCFENTDCPVGQICEKEPGQMNGFCVDAPTPTPEIPCNSDDDCVPPLACVNGFCTDLSTPTPTPTPLPSCETNEDCVRSCEEAGDCLYPIQECVEGQCSPDALCQAFVCVPPRPCDQTMPDSWPSQCRGQRETCLNDICRCGGDCNVDGIVFGSEISRSVCILGGGCGIDACRTADVNGDGEVTGCDVSLSLFNLGLGCPGEGTPLIFAAQRTDEVRTIELPDIEGSPGAIIDFVINIAGGEDVTTAQVDLLYDTSVVDLTVPGGIAPNCQLAERLQGTFFPQITFPQVPRNPEGIQRLRLAVVDREPPLPLDSFGPGPLFTCSLRIQPAAAPGTESSLMPQREEIADNMGMPFDARVTGGSILVTEMPCTTNDECPDGTECRDGFCKPIVECRGPELGPIDCLDMRQACVDNLCVCVGDCNMDGRVRGNEITIMVNIINGDATLDQCQAADYNGDGRVRSNEVTIAINNINEGCP